MKDPVEIIRGRIVAFDRNRKELLIRAPYQDLETLERRQYRECEVRLTDARQLSERQRKAICTLIREISDYSGADYGSLKEALKQKFLQEDMEGTDIQDFSLSNCSMSLAAAFQKFLVRFVLEFDIPCTRALLDYADDQRDYIYSCLLHKRCCVCGKPADLHHCEGSVVGMGRNRKEIPHEGLEAMPLCRIHHGECHQEGQAVFNQRYHLPGGVRLDRRLCDLYHLHADEI